MPVQRFAVRNSGATVVVEGCGNHGCEYMTGGLALILGEVGQNFAAGMTGGVAYVFDQYGTLDARVNHESVELKAPTAGELAQIRELIQEHVDATQSPRGIKLLYSFETMSKHFVKVIPTEYERVLAIVAAGEAVGKTHAQAEELAFDIVTGRATPRMSLASMSRAVLRTLRPWLLALLLRPRRRRKCHGVSPVLFLISIA